MEMDEQMREELKGYQDEYDGEQDALNSDMFRAGKQQVFITGYNVYRKEEKGCHGLTVTLKGAQEDNQDKEGDLFFTIGSGKEHSFSRQQFLKFFGALGYKKPTLADIDHIIEKLKNRVIEGKMKLKPSKSSDMVFLNFDPYRFTEGGEAGETEAPF